MQKHSALLEVYGEDQIPVNADHSGICKFESRDDEVYEKLWKRIHWMLTVEDVENADVGRM